ncbi:hypothetical protein C0J52_01863 [Blattella germanica]|nr:hypothetical protein C0J52_01863 [Blattella germanica]
MNALSSVSSASVGTHQRTYSFPLSELGPHTPWESRRGSTGRMGKRASNNMRSSGRERSDSVPSRPRTVSDGGPHPPHPHTSRSLMANRPHSFVIILHSSPASGPCSTDSPGSSLSIDEVEPEGWGVYGHSLTPDEPVILEENEWSTPSLMLPDHKHSPSQIPTGNFKSGSPNQDAYSPYGSSPLDPVGGYITMSPGTTIPEANTNSRRHATSSSNHSRASSVAEETPNGYVPMAPVDDGYVDMDPVEMSPSSSCSITSGTPSTDMRFSEYPLEKVSSYFTPSEEDETSSLDRPTRAYSVGSRPETLRRNNSRTANKLSARAFAYDLYATRQHPTLTPPHHQLTPTPTPGGKKSLSAPLLCNSWSGGGSLRHHLHGTSSSHSSMEPMDDLMEMDFSRNSKSKSKSSRNKLEERLSTPHTPIADGYVDMRSKQADTRSLAAASPPKSHTSSISPKTSVEYHAQSHPIPTPPKLSVSPKTLHSSAGPYMEMRPGSSPPTKLVVQRKISTVNPPSPEINMSNNQTPNESFNNYGRTTAEGSNFTSVTGQAYAEMHHGFQVASSRKPTSPIQEEYMDMSRPSDEGYGSSISTSARTAPVDTPQPKKPPEGYVEMAWTGGSKPSQRNEDYMNIAFEGRGNSKRKDKRKGRYSSQPIVIQAGENDSSKQQSSSTSPVFSLSGFVGRKQSSGTPPKVAPPAFLPLSHAPNSSPGSSPSSSLRRSKSHKTNRRDSSENTGLTTPTGSTATIFPFSLNSPGSPMKPFPGQQHQQNDLNYDTARKCPVDATSGTVRLSYPFSPESTPTTPDSSSSSSEQPTPVNAESVNDLNKPEDSARNHDYVNYSPFHRSDSMNQQNETYGDYAIMRPVPATASRKISAPARVTTLMSDITLNSPARTNAPKLVTSSSAAPNREAVQFGRPNIIAGSGRGALRTSPITKVNSNGKISRQVSEGRAQENQSTRTGGAISRQLSSSSVGSIEGATAGATGGSPSSSRPPSVSSERELHYASLDLAPSGSEGEEGSRSPRSIKTQGSLTESSTSSPSPNPVGGESSFTYAEIDFAKSEGLRSLNRKH